MYELALTTSHVPAQSDMETREITIGALLREVAGARPDAEALAEVRQDGSKGRRWTYSELLADAERLDHLFGRISGQCYGDFRRELVAADSKSIDDRLGGYFFRLL